jgi:hypothetical protein
MTDSTPAREEYDRLVAKNTKRAPSRTHPGDREPAAREAAYDSREQDEEDIFRTNQINAAMGVSVLSPLSHFESSSIRSQRLRNLISDEQRRERGESGASQQRPVATKRVTPSAFSWGTLQEVDALGFVEAIDNVHKEESVVVVFMYESRNGDAYERGVSSSFMRCCRFGPALLTVVVGPEERIVKDRVGAHETCRPLSGGAVRQGLLRSRGIQPARPSCLPGDPSLQEGRRRSIRKPHQHHRSARREANDS